MPVVVPLTEAEVEEARRLGDETCDALRTNRRYHNNLGPSHRKRKLGEVAVERWALTLGVEVTSPFRDVTLAGREDLVVDGIRVEVKTWHREMWQAMGRSITPNNVETIRRKADAIVWCSLDGAEVTIHGWSTVDDVAAAPLMSSGPKHHPITTHQVPAESLRPMERLLDDAPR